jgi:selenide,water dikinase
MGPEALAQVLRPLAAMFDPARYPDLLRGLGAPDDAAVWRLGDDRALVLTADFFPPVVDDPYHFGAIAAANALSDLYAMGASPLLGINLVGFPAEMNVAILAEILRGGAEKMREAGAVVAGGHTTTDHEPKYGLAVIGTVRPDEILKNEGARPGDVVLLTKAVGTGVVTTALKKGKADAPDVAAAIASMERLSAPALGLLRGRSGAVHALTDVTGFSVAGHAHEMAHGSGVSMRLDWTSIPVLPGVERYARDGHSPGGAGRNATFYEPWITFERDLAAWERRILFDPQTSGGLLTAADPAAAGALEEAFRVSGEPLWRIGEILEGEPGRLVLA